MAFSFVIRKGSSSPAFPLALRAVGSAGSFDAALLLYQHQPTAANKLSSSVGSLQSRRHSSASTTFIGKKLIDENLVRLINAEIESLIPVAKSFPKDFSFTVEKNIDEESIILTREYPTETVKVEFKMSANDGAIGDKMSTTQFATDPNVMNPDDNDDDSDSYSDHEHDSDSDHTDTDNVDEDEGKHPVFPILVTVHKENMCLEFEVKVSTEDIFIDSLKIQEQNNSKDSNPSFSSISAELQGGLSRYLEIRGIKPKLANFLSQYGSNKGTKEQMEWLKKLKLFVI